MFEHRSKNHRGNSMIVSLLKRLDVLVVMCFRVHDFCSDFLAKNIRGIKTGILVMAYASLSGFFFPKLRRDFGNAAIAILFLILFLSTLSQIFRMRRLRLLMGLRRESGVLMACLATVHGIGYALDPAWVIRDDLFANPPFIFLVLPPMR